MRLACVRLGAALNSGYASAFIYLKDYERVDDLYDGLDQYFQFYNQERGARF